MDSKKSTGKNGTDFEDVFRSCSYAEKTTHEPLIRVMALHALAYCERLFYLEEVEEIRMADANVYSGRRLHEELDKGPDCYSIELVSERLGIRGKLDYVKRKSGNLVVYEHKKGKSKDGKEAWPSDRLQVLAYGLLLQEHTGESVTEVCVKYHADNRLITIPVNSQEAEEEVGRAVSRARELRASLDRPTVTVHERYCRTCALAPICLPEEERFALNDKEKPQRLFPADEDRRIIHVVDQGSTLRKEGEQLIVYLSDGTKKPLPGRGVSALVLHGNVQISTQCIHFCAANDIGVHWLSFGGSYVGSLSQGAGEVQRRNRQYRAMQSPLLKTKLAARLMMAKIENQLRYVLRSTRAEANKERPDGVEEGILKLRHELEAIARKHRELQLLEQPSLEDQKRDITEDEVEPWIEELRGHEGMAGKEYFSLLPAFLNVSEGDFMFFSGRNRRPPKDPFNAALSFGYALLYRDCVAGLMAVGLEPAFGILHTPRSAAYPLALDLMEVFRVILWDVPLVGSVNRKQWGRTDFDIAGEQVWLSPEGRRKAIQVYEARKQEKWRHPVLDYSLSYARTIELEARLLEKEWSGQPGLFGKLRLR